MLKTRAIILNPKGEILLGQNIQFLQYNLIGGKAEEGEEPEAALLREIKEEAGIESTLIQEIKYLFTFDENLIYEVKIKPLLLPPNSYNDPDKEFANLQWFELDNLPLQTSEWAENVLFQYFQNILNKNKIETITLKQPLETIKQDETNWRGENCKNYDDSRDICLDNYAEAELEVYIDGEKVADLPDDEIWLAMPGLAQEQTKGHKIEYRQKNIKVESSVEELESIKSELCSKYFKEIEDTPIKIYFEEMEEVGKSKFTTLEIALNAELKSFPKLVRQTLAHELLHIWLFHMYGDTITKHGEHFQMKSADINEVEGANYITPFADDTNFKV